MTQKFGAESTTVEVLAGVDLSGKTCLVTGVSAGLSVETARALVAHGAHVTGAARALAKARAATAQIQAPQGAPGGFELVELDLASLASVRACAAALVAAGRRLDIVIANAGIMASPQNATLDGFETQFGTNHLGHFVRVNHIISLLRPGSRLVNLSSLGHRYADVDLDDPNFTRTKYDEFVAYGRSKTANILFTVEFDRRYKQSGIRAAAVHPSGIQTELNRHTPVEVTEKLIASINAQRAPARRPLPGKPLRRALPRPSGAGVAPPGLVGGLYCENCQVAKVTDEAHTSGGVRSYALDRDRANALWAISEDMVGERFADQTANTM